MADGAPSCHAEGPLITGRRLSSWTEVERFLSDGRGIRGDGRDCVAALERLLLSKAVAAQERQVVERALRLVNQTAGDFRISAPSPPRARRATFPRATRVEGHNAGVCVGRPQYLLHGSCRAPEHRSDIARGRSLYPRRHGGLDACQSRGDTRRFVAM